MGNLKDFYLGTPMLTKDYAYMCIPVAILPDEVIDHYNLHPLVHKGHVYVEIQHGMYRLPQAGKLANVQLQTFLSPTDTTHAPSHQACGLKPPMTSGSRLLLTTLWCIIQNGLMLITC